VIIGIQTVISIKKKKWICYFVFLTIPFFISGCSSSDSGKQSAYEIRDQLNAGINVEATKSTSLQTQPSANNNQKKAVNAKGANIVNAGDTINYLGFSLQIEGVQLGNTIYDVSNIMSKDEADEYCKWVLSGEANGKIQQDGTFKGHDQLAFIKCRIKNNNNSLTRINMMPDFYGVKNSKWGLVAIGAFGYSGKHESYYDSQTGITVKQDYVFEPGEELETVFMIGMSKIEGNFDLISYRYSDENVDIYMASDFLNGKSSGPSSDVPTGDYLIPIFKNGQATN